MRYRVADAHADVLMRMVQENLSFYTQELEMPEDSGSSVVGRLQASYDALLKGGIATQVFALFVSPRLSEHEQLMAVLEQIDCFVHSVAEPGLVRLATSIRTIEKAQSQDEIVGMLSLEGAGSLHASPTVLRSLFRLGVRGIGLTWNPANRLADGCMEPRNAGLSKSGMAIVREVERLPMWLDLAHLGDASVADVLQVYSKPLMASHANARAVHHHPRNLTDEVIQVLKERRGWMGLTFESSFLSSASQASLYDLGYHIDHVLALGGHDILGFGSDFDGGITPMKTVPTSAEYGQLAAWLTDRYGAELTEKMLYGNFHRFLSLVLD